MRERDEEISALALRVEASEGRARRMTEDKKEQLRYDNSTVSTHELVFGVVRHYMIWIVDVYVFYYLKCLNLVGMHDNAGVRSQESFAWTSLFTLL